MRRKRIIVLLFLLLGITGVLAAEGNETVDLLKSPDILASGGSYTSEFSPMADIINPAASALQQRLSFNLNFSSLFGDASAAGVYNGTSFNLGAAIPLRSGVITGNGYILATDALTELNAGFQGGLRAGFAKELYPDLLTGAAVNIGFGESWSVTADIGIIRKQGDVGFMKAMKWGVVLGELGYSGFGQGASQTDYPSMFTPGGGISFNLLDTDNFDFGVNSELSFPTFQNVRFTLGGSIDLFNFAGIQFSSTADLVELMNNDPSALVPAFGVYVNFTTNFENQDFSEKGWAKNDVRTSVSASPMANGLWAAGAGLNVNLGVVDQSAPEIFMDLSGFGENAWVQENTEAADGKGDETAYNFKKGESGKREKTLRTVAAEKSKSNKGNIDRGPSGEKIISYISPNNDGIKDSIEIPVSIKDSRYIKGFSFIVEDENGNEVKRIENKEKRPENVGLANFFERLFYVEKGVDIPETIRWDGNSNSGEVVPDGFYRFYMQAWDDNGNISTTEKYGLVVDNTPPSIKIEKVSDSDKIFSPNNDGNKDVFEIVQSGSQEDSWTAVIKSAGGKVYKNYQWNGVSPGNITWDGKDDKKLLVPDGVYFYYIESTDRAGNSATAEISNIIINTQTTPISLSVDASYFAPGITGSVSKVRFTPDVPVKTGITEWLFRVLDSKGVEVYRKNDGTIPDYIDYDGKKDNSYISEGTYKGVLNIKYINGNNPIVESPPVIADKTAPTASAKASLKVFSPNGDGNKDTLAIYQETSVEDAWYAEIKAADGSVVRQYKWMNNAESSIVWDGYTTAGTLAPDGVYSYRLYSQDRAGNKGQSEPISFDLDTEETPVILTASPEAFSPNGDGVKDSMNLTPVLNVSEGIQSYSLVITDSAGTVVKRISSEGRIRDRFVWDGVTDAGRKAPDGTYRAAIEVVYLKGNVSNAVTRDFVLDTTFPEINIDTDYTLFSPDKDGSKDSINIAQSTSNEKLITGTIKNEKGVAVREYFWDGKAKPFVWDGTDSNGNTVPDGRYTYTVSIEDAAGNKTEKSIKDITVDNRQANVFVTADKKGFTPNADGVDDRIEFSTIATLKDGVDRWEFRILQNGVTTVKTFNGDTLPEKIIWDGKTDNGRVIEGVFKAEYRVVYKKGNEPVSTTKDFKIDISAPDVEISVKPQPFSPDNDGVDDELEISIGVKDASEIRDWSLEIVDRQGNPFTDFGGKGVPAEKIYWDGISKTGELVIAAEDYPYRLSVEDIYGNKTMKYGVIPVDVLVVKEGDKLKIRIANINFAPNSAQLRSDDPAIIAKNEYVLGRLSEILQKYSNYKIRIEGYAVSVYWADTKRAEREQQEELIPLSKARAETVKSYLEQLGIAGSRMTTVGEGGNNPIVPHGDLDNRWKNRRVEFILIK